MVESRILLDCFEVENRAQGSLGQHTLVGRGEVDRRGLQGTATHCGKMAHWNIVGPYGKTVRRGMVDRFGKTVHWDMADRCVVIADRDAQVLELLYWTRVVLLLYIKSVSLSGMVVQGLGLL